MQKLIDKFHNVNIDATISNEMLTLKKEKITLKLSFPKKLQDEIKKTINSNRMLFSYSDRTLIKNSNTVEIELDKLTDNYIPQRHSKIQFSSKGLHEIIIDSASPDFRHQFLISSEEDKFFRFIQERMEFLSRSSINDFEKVLRIFSHTPQTITFKTKKRKLSHEDLKKLANKYIRSCLLTLAVENNICFEVCKPKKDLRSITKTSVRTEFPLPMANYDTNLCNYFKVGVSSKFPSQSFLSFYHVLEYFFLKVSEEQLHLDIKGQINSTAFSSNEKKVDKLIATIKNHNNNANEKTMLHSVLLKYVPSSDLIEFIKNHEKQTIPQIYTKKSQVFGEKLSISLNDEDVRMTTAHILKHIRNALVHSTDKYTREECHRPLSESDEIVEKYIPLIRFLSETIIFSTAT